MVKLNIVDLVCCSCLESLPNYGVLLIRYLHLEVVKDGLEPSEGHKT